MRRLLPRPVLSVFSLVLLMLSVSSAGVVVPQFRLHDTKGTVHASAEWSDAKIILLFFVSADCPVANSYVPEMNRIAASYAARGVRAYAVQADPGIGASSVVEYAESYHYRFPLLLDPQQVLVKLTAATVTPEAVLLTPKGDVLYRGRIDNRVVDFGRERPKATVHDLRDALEAVLAGKAVTTPFTTSVGCAITRVR